ncbi:hypothetical protein HEP73_02159 [Xanthomonas sp. GW]|uniref:hypothetical protein n=1 Tax=Xanthomonas sp. GW TaxID=2724121 RepID=UPI00163B1E43|nr:hypothetical protein [Xanthomonas sp. GW]QNH21245.1 hypothetical protein HEP73_02159 [Xanthomonas sp. GW]
MHIIKRGRDPSAGEHHRSTCRRCGTKFEWHTGEATVLPDHRDGDYYQVICPVCSHAVTKAIDTRYYA